MTPQEQQLVDDLFDRLAKLETAPRDADAERLIAAGLQRAPHAAYALVQTALVQDEALKRANARIEELQAQLSADEEPAPAQRPASFLNSMREAFTGRAPGRGSVPSVRADAPGYQSQAFQSPGGQPRPGYQMPPPGYPGALGSGGSFLGTAASAAAGVIGGALLLDGIRSMFGHSAGGYGSSAFGNFAGDRTSPWSAGTGSAADSDLARQAGIDHVGDAANRDAASPNAADDPLLQSAGDLNDADDLSDTDFADDDDFGGGDGGFGGGDDYA